MNVYIREDKLKNNEELWIGFESTVLPGDLELLKTFKNFEYSEPQEYISNNKKVLLHLLKFKNLTDDRKQMLLAIVNEYIEPLDQNKVTILDIFEMFHDYFAKEDDDFIIKKLIGDLGEIIFILKLQTLGIDYKKYYQPQDFSLYDFNFNGMCIDVKTTSAKNKAIYISKRQLESTQKIGFFVCEINQLSNFHNIIELINKIIHKNQLIKQKLEYWLKKDKVNHNLINSWTIDLEKIVCYFVDQKIIPKIQILHNGGLIELQAKISVAGGNKEPLDKVKTFLFSK